MDGAAVTVLKKGSYFGEIGLLRNCRRTATVSALSEACDLFVLSKARRILHTNREATSKPLHAALACCLRRAISMHAQ